MQHWQIDSAIQNDENTSVNRKQINLFIYFYPKDRGNEFSCVCLHGDRKPHERKANLDKFKVSSYKRFYDNVGAINL